MLCSTTSSSSSSSSRSGNSRMEVKNVIVSLILFNFAILAIGAAPKKPVDVVFHRNYVPSWSPDHIKYLNGGYTVDLLLDKYSGLFVCLLFSALSIPLTTPPLLFSSRNLEFFFLGSD